MKRVEALTFRNLALLGVRVLKLLSFYVINYKLKAENPDPLLLISVLKAKFRPSMPENEDNSLGTQSAPEKSPTN